VTSCTSPSHPAPSRIADSGSPMVILVPAYEPDRRLVELVQSLMAAQSRHPIVIVDDGSGPQHSDVFAEAATAGCDVIGHTTNRGKGYALRAGFSHILKAYPGHDVVCADCDGQHTMPDIARVATALGDNPHGIVLGSRQLSGDVPARSRFGNVLTRYAFFAVTRQRLHDTQTGLRAYPAERLDWLLSIEGDRFEYELNSLLAARKAGIGVIEVPISTIYLDGNKSSHFEPIRDSIRIYRPLVAYSLSSLAAFGIDFGVLLAMMAATDRLAVSVATARVVSASFNFAINRRLVFKADSDRAQSARRYFALALGIVVANYGLMRLLTGLGVGLIVSKLIVESTLFVVSFNVQRHLVFSKAT
jgi:putative flippase GtrA